MAPSIAAPGPAKADSSPPAAVTQAGERHADGAPPDATVAIDAGAAAASGAAPAGEPDDAAPLVLAVGEDPEYPAILTRRLRKGWVRVRLSVAPGGAVEHAEILASSHPRLDEPTLVAVKRWVFVPPGQARQATAELEFDLDGR
jgi:TonB family protein